MADEVKPPIKIEFPPDVKDLMEKIHPGAQSVKDLTPAEFHRLKYLMREKK